MVNRLFIFIERKRNMTGRNQDLINGVECALQDAKAFCASLKRQGSRPKAKEKEVG